jgi:hypothetical protein
VKGKRDLVEVIVLVVYLAGLFTLARPGSQGPALIAAAGATLAGIITAATGGGSWNTKPEQPTAGGAPTPAPAPTGTVYA